MCGVGWLELTANVKKDGVSNVWEGGVMRANPKFIHLYTNSSAFHSF